MNTPQYLPISSRVRSALRSDSPLRALVLGAAAAGLLTGQLSAGLVNGSFEVPVLTPGVPDFGLFNEAVVTGWQTTASDDLIEIWSNSFNDSPFGAITAFDGNNHAELNANVVSTLFQDAGGAAAGERLDFRFAHRGRNGDDTLRLTITDFGLNGLLGGGDDTVLFTKQYTTGGAAWAQYTSGSEAPILALGNTMRFAYESVSVAGGSPSVGNFLDDADFGVGVAIPEPTTALFGLALCGMTLIRRRR